jgi:colicin import membrane protein
MALKHHKEAVAAIAAKLLVQKFNGGALPVPGSPAIREAVELAHALLDDVDRYEGDLEKAEAAAAKKKADDERLERERAEGEKRSAEEAAAAQKRHDEAEAAKKAEAEAAAKKAAEDAAKKPGASSAVTQPVAPPK